MMVLSASRSWLIAEFCPIQMIERVVKSVQKFRERLL
jgi:hypothetical protein